MIDVAKRVPPNLQLLEKIFLSFFYGAKIGVLGFNGSGKSTLLRIIAGEDKEYSGEVTSQKGLRFGYLPQEPQLNPNKTVRENVEEGVQETKDLLEEFYALSAQLGTDMSPEEMDALLEKQGKLQDKIDATNAWELDRKLEIAADALRLPAWDADVSNLSGGEKRRVALCKLLLSNPDVLLLDEPTNHLDAQSVAWLETFLKEFPGTVIAVTHDRYFLDNVAGWILELDRGRGIPFEGNYTSWLEQKESRLLQEQRTEAARQRVIKSELEWIHKNPKGRRTKNQARINNFEALLAQAQNTERATTEELYIPAGVRLGETVFDIKNISKTIGDKCLISDLSFKVPRGAIVGIIGPNGAGKTTFFKMLTGEVKPDSGEIITGDTVDLAYVDQSRDALNNDKNVWEEISDGLDYITVGQTSFPSRAYVGRFNFKGAAQQKNIGTLSGGERNRVHLAKLLRKGGNVLLLDEPTNDLDVETLRALEEALLNFAGCAMVISHDRWFLDRIATHILSFEDESQVRFFEGSYTEYEADRIARLGVQGAQPHRVKYKRLSTVKD